LSEIARLAELDKSAAQRFSYTLEVLGYLRKDPVTRRYSLAPKILSLGYEYLQTDSIVRHATPVMESLSRALDETVNLTELDNADVVYVARFVGSHPVTVNVLLGSRMPAFCSAPGRAMLAHLPAASVDAVLAGPLPAMTAKTVTDPAVLRERLAEVRRKGFALAAEETYLGDLSVAAPVFDNLGGVAAAINVAMPLSRITPDRAERDLAPSVVTAAQEISGILAAQPSLSGPDG
jgi:DNA-binding IclR family transcriptional regulator